jgi:hypothetical protein
MLENHAGGVTAKIHKLLLVVTAYVFAVYTDSAAGCIDKAKKHPDKRGLTASGQTHDNEKLTPFYVKGYISYRHHTSGFFQYAFFGGVTQFGVKNFIGFFAKDFP